MGVVVIPNINQRRRIPRRAIQNVVKQIADQYAPDKIILFGSYAYGKPRPESDVDLLVVMKYRPQRNRAGDSYLSIHFVSLWTGLDGEDACNACTAASAGGSVSSRSGQQRQGAL